MTATRDIPAAHTDAGGCCIVHASCVSFDGRGLLILGPSGAGKSALALQLMALGAGLVSDDRTCLHRDADMLWARAPDSIRGMIEARGIGLLSASAETQSPVRLIVDLAHTENERLPPDRLREILGLQIPLLHKVESVAFPAGVLQYLKGGRCA